MIVAGVAGRLPLAEPSELGLWLGPAAVEYVAVHLGALPYRAGRTWVFGACLGIGLGRTFHRYLVQPSDPVVWVTLALLGLVCGGAAAYHLTLKNREL